MFDQLLEQIATGLDRRQIPYMVIGGQAVLLYGDPRLTKDIDVTLGIGTERLAEVLRLVEERGWRVLSSNPSEFVAKSMVLPCEDPHSGIRIDFIFSTSAYEREAMLRVRKVPFGEIAVCFASAEDLVIHKIVAGRPRDLEDVRVVLLKQPSVDPHYVRRWLGEFGSSLDQDFLDRFETIWSSTRSGQGSSGS